MVNVWNLYRGGDFSSGHLPDAGGIMDQSALMIDALQIMVAAEAKILKKNEKRKGKKHG